MAMTSMRWHFLSCFILFFGLSLSHQTFRLTTGHKTQQFEIGHESDRLKYAYTMGHKRRLRKIHRQVHKRFGLQHLFTPSGLHLSSLFVFLYFLKYSLRKKLYLAFLPIYFFDGYFSIKRILFIKILQNWFSLKVSFYLVFLFDLVLGSFWLSPYSLAYSYLFLGIFILKGKTHSAIPYLLMAHLLTNLFNYGFIEPLPLIFGFFFSLLFSCLFPIVLFSSFLSFDTMSTLVVDFYWNIISYTDSHLPIIGGQFTLPFLLAIFSKRKSALIVLLFLFSSPLSAPMKIKISYKGQVWDKQINRKATDLKDFYWR